MQERTFENLIFNGKDLFLEGAITIKGSFEMNGSKLIVSGNLTILGDDGVEIENGDIIVSGDLIIRPNINIKGVNISCDYLYCCDVNISDGDIWTNTNLFASNITSDGKDLFLEGYITIEGSLEMNGAKFIVSRDLTILGGDGVEIENGDIIVSGDLTIEKNINIKGVNISCNCLQCSDINISDGDIWTNTDLLASTSNITSDGNIEVKGSSNVANVTCLNYLVAGYNDSASINASHDIYILNDNDSCDLTAREILIDGNCYTNGYPITAQEIVIDGDCISEGGSITAHHFVCTGELSCKGLSIG